MAVDASVVPQRRSPGSRPVVRQAGRVVLLAAAIGLLGQLLLFDVGLGINAPIFLALVLLGGWLVRGARGPTPLDAWLAPAAVAFASFAAIRADPFIVGCDVLTALALSGGALASFGGRPVVARAFSDLVGLGLGVAGWVLGGAILAVAGARSSLPSAATARGRASGAMPILRGLVVAVPLLVVFIALFSSADAVFARWAENLFGWDLDLGDAGWRVALAAFLAWLAGGSLGLAATPPPTVDDAPGPAPWRFGTTELLTVLVSVDVLFLAFVALQGAYLFGGLDTLAAAGMTYADYARRGFFELVAAAMLAGGTVIAAERLAVRRTRTLVGAAVALALLTGVILLSATLRLRLYQEAYGWTELRLYVLGTIVVLAIGLVALVGALLTDRVRFIGHALVVTALVVGFALNVLGPVRFITEQNVARVLHPELVPPDGQTGLDLEYVLGLGEDGIPELLRALPALDASVASSVRSELRIRLDELRLDPTRTAWQAWNLGRATAREALEASLP
jgi:hypothetical protein